MVKKGGDVNDIHESLTLTWVRKLAEKNVYLNSIMILARTCQRIHNAPTQSSCTVMEICVDIDYLAIGCPRRMALLCCDPLVWMNQHPKDKNCATSSIKYWNDIKVNPWMDTREFYFTDYNDKFVMQCENNFSQLSICIHV